MLNSYVKTKDGTEPIIAYTVDEFKPPILNFKPLQRNHKIINYATEFLTLDTETSKIDLETAWIYQWAIKFKNMYIYGRKPTEIIDLLRKLAEHYELKEDKRIIIYIHNAAYDLQYLKNYLYEYDPSANFMSLDAHAILICDILGFRILCSYKLSNMSLAQISENYAEKYIKAVGEIDYNLIRYQDTELNENDWFYMFSDVASQHDAINGYLKMQGYKYAFESPFTSTGFVRAKCRKAARNDDSWRREFWESALDLEQYNLARQCFMGGVCIASFKYSNVTIRSDKLRHKDFTSSYPARQMLDYFPTGAPSWYGDIESNKEFENLLNTYCCIFALTLYDVHIKQGITAPCIPSSKCIHITEPLRLNGKVVYAKELTIIVCELDYKWIKRQYDFDNFSVDKMLIFERGEIPKWLKDEVMEYFNNKCTLKGVDDMLYAKSKAYLNSIYGMTATAIIRDEYKMNGNHILQKQEYDEDSADTRLNRYYKSYNNFMPYQFSIWTTAHARDALYTMIECAGYDNFLYCDTDSVFYIETPENKKKMDEYTNYCKQRAIDGGAYVGDKYLGMPTDEPKLKSFRALHSKCYAMEEMTKSGDYKLNVVIAGIPKKAIKWIAGKPVQKTNAEELENIDNLQDGFTFSHCGGTRCVYNERPTEVQNIHGHITELSSSAVIDNIDKVISDTMWTVGEDYSILDIVQTT